MKIDDIAVGKAYYINQHGYGVCVAIGKYEFAHTGGRKKVLTWNGADILFEGSYATSASVTQRRAVFVVLKSGMAQTVVVTPATVSYEANDQNMQKELAVYLAKRTANKTVEDWTRKKANYTQLIKDVIVLIQPKTEGLPYYAQHSDDPFAQLFGSEVLQQMVLLFLQYHLAKEEPVNGYSDVESLIESLKEGVRGKKNMPPSPNANTNTINALALAAQGSLAAEWKPRCTPVVSEVKTDV